MSKENIDKNLTIEGHLSELRKRIMISLGVLIVTALIGYQFSEFIARDIVSKAPDMEFIYISPSELMLSYIKIALVCGVVIAAPVLISQIWLFVKPGLSKKEGGYVKVAFALGGGFFIIGVAFAYQIVLPFLFKFLAEFQTDYIKATISFEKYLTFVIRTVLSFGLVFELPMIMFILSLLGLVKSEFFIKNRKYMILVIFVTAAILTPPDVVSQTMLAVPMLILYEVGIVLSKIAGKTKKGNKKEEEKQKAKKDTNVEKEDNSEN